MLSLNYKLVSTRTLGPLIISVMVIGTLASLGALAIPAVKADPAISVNRQDAFEGINFNTTGTLTYNSTFVTGGSLTVKATDGTIIVSTTYTIRAQKAGNNAVRFVLFAHVNDSSNIETAAYLYVDVSTGSITAYFAARNDDFNQNGTIDISDYSYMQAHYGYCSGSPEYAPPTDLNASGCTDINDLSVVQVTYGFPAYR